MTATKATAAKLKISRADLLMKLRNEVTTEVIQINSYVDNCCLRRWPSACDASHSDAVDNRLSLQKGRKGKVTVELSYKPSWPLLNFRTTHFLLLHFPSNLFIFGSACQFERQTQTISHAELHKRNPITPFLFCLDSCKNELKVLRTRLCVEQSNFPTPSFQSQAKVKKRFVRQESRRVGRRTQDKQLVYTYCVTAQY